MVQGSFPVPDAAAQRHPSPVLASLFDGCFLFFGWRKPSETSFPVTLANPRERS